MNVIIVGNSDQVPQEEKPVDNDRRWLKSAIDEQTYNFYEGLWNTKHSA